MRIEYNSELKIWKGLDYQLSDYVNNFIGHKFLQNYEKCDPEKIIELHYDSGRKRSMKDIHQDAITVAINLQRLGIKKGDVMVIYSAANWKISCLAMAGFILGVSVNFFDTTFKEDLVKYGMKLLSPTILLYEEKFKPLLLEIWNELRSNSLKYKISLDGKYGGESVDDVLFKPISQLTRNNFKAPNLGDPRQVTACLLFTSGSTGYPKAVALSHCQMLHGALMFWSEPQKGETVLKPNSIICSFSPMRWISQVVLMLQSLLIGVKRISVADFYSGAYGSEVICQTKTTHFFSPPLVYREILSSIDPNDKETLKCLEAMYFVGENPPANVIEMAKNLAPKALLIRGYGMTELAGIIACDTDINGGFLHSGVEVKILDDNLKPVTVNVKGQLCARLPMPFLGYHKIDNSQVYYSDGFLNTGDYAYIDQNNALHIMGRYKDLVRTKHAILIPSVIEQLICTLPRVFAAVLIGYRKSQTDWEDKGAVFVVAVKQPGEQHPEQQTAIINKGGNTSNQRREDEQQQLVGAIRDLLQKHLKPSEANIIRLIRIIDKHPLTSCRKVDKPALIKLAKSLDKM